MGNKSGKKGAVAGNMIVAIAILASAVAVGLWMSPLSFLNPTISVELQSPSHADEPSEFVNAPVEADAAVPSKDSKMHTPVSLLMQGLDVLYGERGKSYKEGFTSPEQRSAVAQACATIDGVYKDLEEAGIADQAEFRNTPVVLKACRLQLAAFEVMEKAEQDLHTGGTYPRPVRSIPVENNLSWKRYVEEYAMTKTPVIITGEQVDAMLHKEWTLDRVGEVCGDKEVALSKSGRDLTEEDHEEAEDGAQWADLFEVAETTVSEFISALKTRTLGPLYLFDWSLPSHCPELLEDGFTVPSYFASDFFQALPRDLDMRDGWPSLLVGPNGTGAALHKDTYATHFWMRMVQGTKRWRVYPASDTPFLYRNHFFDTFHWDGFDQDLEQMPLGGMASAWEAILRPGQLIIVPGGSPHEVRNLEDTVSVAGNFLDWFNLDEAVDEVATVAVSGTEVQQELWERLEAMRPKASQEFPVISSIEPTPLEYEAFKASVKKV